MRQNTLGLLALLLLASPAAATPIDWHLYQSSCSGGAGAVEFACGSYGRFILLQTAAPPGCDPIKEGSENPPGYPAGPGMHAFPIPARRLNEAAPIPVPATAPARKKERLSLRGTGAQAAVATNQPGPLGDPWVAVVDFDSPHGDSTTWLADQVAGASVDAVLSTLDDAALNVLGEVSDFHVLAKLCGIARVADSGSMPPPLTINMSFGRPTRAVDPKTASACPLPNAACEIAQVVNHLKSAGSWLVAASGNHREQLFPAALDDVLAAGMLDLNAFLAGGHNRPAWETPPDVEAWIPGNALCLESWAAPAGSSYSSAILSGWLVRVLDNPVLLNSLPEGPWRVAWDNLRRCFVLAKGRKLTPYCNAAVTKLFDDLVLAPTSGCGARSSGPSVSSTPPSQAVVPAPLASLDTWGDPTHPAPESDPCVPCTGSITSNTGGSDLQLDLSQSGSLPTGIHLDEVALRVEDSFYPLELVDDDLLVFEDGGLGSLVIHGAGGWIAPGSSLSLWYQLKPTLNTDCSASNACFWSSTPLLVAP